MMGVDEHASSSGTHTRTHTALLTLAPDQLGKGRKTQRRKKLRLAAVG